MLIKMQQIKGKSLLTKRLPECEHLCQRLSLPVLRFSDWRIYVHNSLNAITTDNV